MKEQIKKHLISFAVTFVAMFLLFLYPAIEAGNWEANIILSAVIAASRSAFKFAWEGILAPLFNSLAEWAKNYVGKSS